MNYGLNDLWSTTVKLSKIKDKDLLDNLIQEIFASPYMNNPPSDFQDFDILRDTSEISRKFLKTEVAAVFDEYLQEVLGINLRNYQAYQLRSWLAGTNNSYMIPTHNHSGAALSAVFYLLTDTMGKGGEIELLDPRINANRGYDKNFKKLFDKQTLTPQSGDIIIFPSFVYHYTLPFSGSIRLAIPVDLMLDNPE
jgi:hypothetical protein